MRTEIGLLAAFALACLVPLAGCVSGKAVDSTVAAETSLNSDGENAQLVMLQGKLLDDPALADKIVVIPTVEGKNVRFTARYPDGTVKYDLVTSRSEVVDSALTRINEIDSGKFAHDRYLFEQTLLRLDRLVEMLGPIAIARVQGSPAANDPTVKQQIMDALVPQLLAELERRGLPVVPRPTPTP